MLFLNFLNSIFLTGGFILVSNVQVDAVQLNDRLNLVLSLLLTMMMFKMVLLHVNSTCFSGPSQVIADQIPAVPYMTRMDHYNFCGFLLVDKHLR